MAVLQEITVSLDDQTKGLMEALTQKVDALIIKLDEAKAAGFAPVVLTTEGRDLCGVLDLENRHAARNTTN